MEENYLSKSENTYSYKLPPDIPKSAEYITMVFYWNLLD